MGSELIVINGDMGPVEEMAEKKERGNCDYNPVLQWSEMGDPTKINYPPWN